MSHRSAFSERVFHENAGVYTGAITANLFLGWCDANMYVNTVNDFGTGSRDTGFRSCSILSAISDRAGRAQMKVYTLG